MEISPVANDLIEAIENYMEASNKKEYRFTIEEQNKLQFYIRWLESHIDALIEYELKKERK